MNNVDELVSSASASLKAQWERLHGTWREQGETLAIANTAIEQVEQANLLWALVFLPNSLLCMLSSTEVDLM